GRAKPLFDQDRDRFRQFLKAQASIRGLPHALMVRGDLSIIERADLQTSGDFIAPSSGALKEVGDGEPQIALLAEAKTVGAANQVSTGNLQVQVPIRRGEGDLAQLGETFNNMTQELRTQRDDLMRARDLIDSRRRFTEAVLAGASAGVIGIDPEGRISIVNRSAEKLIARTQADILGRPFAAIVPELAPLFEEARAGPQRLVQGQVTINRGRRERILSVRVTTEQSAVAGHGYVVTLDDITELVIAQRSSAWADVARRIAHEIKNPLTPIQLSAERLRRKYGAIIVEERAVFEQCTDTIVRQVEDIKRMVDEFSRFARMPKPVITPEDLAD